MMRENTLKRPHMVARWNKEACGPVKDILRLTLYSKVKSLNRKMVSRRRPRLRLEVTRDQAGTFIEGDISPSPLKEHHDTIAESDQKQDVNKQPRQPCRQSAQMHQVQVGHRFVAADCRHAALIKVPKALWFSAFYHGQN